jgi:hypothetical protein
MIHSIAISVNDPLHVAQVLVEVWEGHLLRFPFFPNSYLVLAKDEFSTSIEIYPNNTEFVLNENKETVEFFYSILTAERAKLNAAIAVPASSTQITEIATRQGWRVVQPTEGLTKRIEFWVENQIKLELLPHISYSLEVAH